MINDNDNFNNMPLKRAALFMVVMALSLLVILALLVLLYGGCCPKIARPSVTAYEIDKNKCSRTPMGACIILNSNIVDEFYLPLVDKLINETEVCLKDWFENKDDILHRVPNWKPPKRSCFTIYIVDDWHISCEDDGKWQVFGHAPPEACKAKGFEEDPNCPCAWRGVLQNGNTIIVPPDLKFLRVEVVELLTGYKSNDQWATPELVRCGGF